MMTTTRSVLLDKLALIVEAMKARHRAPDADISIRDGGRAGLYVSMEPLDPTIARMIEETVNVGGEIFTLRIEIIGDPLLL